MHRAALIVAHQRSGRRPSRERIDQAAISRRYCDQGDPRFCGRITGMSGDVKSANWLVAHFKRIGQP